MISRVRTAWKRWAARRVYARENDHRDLTVKIRGVTPAQAEAIEAMLHQWVALGGMGASRWVCFYADGDGNFRPRITVNGRKPRWSEYLKTEESWRGDECRIDFDTIAWRMRS